MSSKEGRIALAINAYNTGYFTGIREAARAYNVPNTTLQQRLRGSQPRVEIRPKTTKLSPTEELALEQWILSMDNRGLPVQYCHIRDMAILLLQNRIGSSADALPSIGSKWPYNFVKRYASIKTRYNRKYDYKRAECEDPVKLRAWFRLVSNTIAKYRIQPEDIYNFDETGFQIGVITTTSGGHN